MIERRRQAAHSLYKHLFCLCGNNNSLPQFSMAFWNLTDVSRTVYCKMTSLSMTFSSEINNSFSAQWPDVGKSILGVLWSIVSYSKECKNTPRQSFTTTDKIDRDSRCWRKSRVPGGNQCHIMCTTYTFLQHRKRMKTSNQNF